MEGFGSHFYVYFLGLFTNMLVDAPQKVQPFQATSLVLGVQGFCFCIMFDSFGQILFQLQSRTMFELIFADLGLQRRTLLESIFVDFVASI